MRGINPAKLISVILLIYTLPTLLLTRFPGGSVYNMIMGTTDESSDDYELTARYFKKLCQKDGSLVNHGVYGNILKQHGGICWAIAASEAIASLIDEESMVILDRLARVSYTDFPKNFAEITSYGRGVSGGFPPFIREGRPGMISQDGGLERFYRLYYPAQTANFINYILKEMLKVPVRCDIPLRSLVLPCDNLLTILASNYSPDAVAILALDLKTYSRGYQIDKGGHMVFLSGIRKSSEGLIKGIRVSDPDLTDQVWLTHRELGQLTSPHGLLLEKSPQHSVYAVVPELSPLIWLYKEDTI